MKERILVADDEESIRFTFQDFLDAAGYRVDTTDSLTDCIRKMQEESYDVLFLDIGFGDDNGIDAIEKLKELQPRCRVVIMTGSPRLQSLVQAKKYGACDYLAKPIREASLLYNVQKLLSPQVAEARFC